PQFPGTAYAAATGRSVFRSGPAATEPIATTTTTLPSGSTPTTLPTTIRPVSRCAGGCDDGDPCTVDGCVLGTCHHDDEVGVAGATCDLSASALVPPSCAQDAISIALRSRVEGARRMIERAPSIRSSRRARRVVRAASQRLRRAARLVHRDEA